MIEKKKLINVLVGAIPVSGEMLFAFVTARHLGLRH